jgi:Flp pilus assembly protein CpaB
LNKLYIFALVLVAAFGVISVLVSRMRRTPDPDHVAQNVLDRIRTEYR